MTAFAWKLAVSPLSWTNDVLEDLGGDIPLETCLRESASAGFAGVELGRKFPRDPEILGPLLAAHRLALASGWYSGFLAERSVAEEWDEVRAHATLLSTLGAKAMVYGECGRMAPGGAPLDEPMSARALLSGAEFHDYAERLAEFGRRLEGEYGLKLAYHHHLMMVAETFDEVSRVIAQTGLEVGLLLDTGHAVAAGFAYEQLIERFGDRIVHIHLKDVRADVLGDLRARDGSFNDGVRAGMFAVPGDGIVDFRPVARFIHDTNYAGWLVVEAEGDPAQTPPLPAVTRGRANILPILTSPILTSTVLTSTESLS